MPDPRPAGDIDHDVTDRQRRDRFIGIALMMVPLILFTILDTSAKWLGQALPVLMIVAVRYIGHFLAAVVVLNPLSHPQAWRTRRPGLQVIRGMLLAGSTGCNFLALQHMQLAETMTVSFSAPLIIAAAAGPVLGEWLGPRRWAAILVGFCGVLLVLRPGLGAFNPFMIAAFGNAACYAGYALLTRKLSGVDSPGSMLLISAAVPSLVLAPLLVIAWQPPPSLLHWTLLLLTGILGSSGHWFLIKAHERAPAAILAPWTYTQLVWMTLSGWLVFGDLPGPATLAGAGIVVASGLYLLYRDRVAGRR